MYGEDDVDLDRAGATGDITLPALPPGVKFTITSTMIQLFTLNGMFRGAANDYYNQELMNFGNLQVTGDSRIQPNNNKVAPVSVVS